MEIKMTRELAFQIAVIMEEQNDIDLPKIERALAGEPRWKKLAATQGFITETYVHIARMADPRFELGDDRVQVGKMAHRAANMMLEPEDGDYGRG